MSSAAAARAAEAAARRPRPVEAPRRPTLRLVATSPLTAGRLPFALLVGAILTAGLVGLLMLHTLAAQDAFQLQRLQQTQATLGDSAQQLALDTQRMRAPAVLAERARALGMVPTGSIAFVKVGHHGKLIGVAHAAPPPPPPAPAPTAKTGTKTGKTGADTGKTGAKPGTSGAKTTKTGTATKAGTTGTAAHKPAAHRRAATAGHG